MVNKTSAMAIWLFAFLFMGTNVQSQAVINEVYVGGGNTGATYTNDAVVLKGTPNASLMGWSIQYTGASGTSWSGTQINFLSSAVFSAQGFFYIQYGSGGANGVALPNPPFTTGSNSFASVANNMSATGGKIALRNVITSLVDACPTGVPTGTGVNIVDFIGYGTANCAEGSGATGSPEPVPASSATQSMRRTGADTNNNANDFSPVAVLPVELLDFQVKRDNENVLIYWVTAREKDNGHFVVEHSTDGKNYEELSVVKGAGTTNLLQQYSIKDTNPSKGMNYYRLKQVDIDGKFEYSFIRSINFGVKYTVALAPNPVLEGSTMTLNVQSENESELTMSIFNTLGQLMLQKQISAVKGDNQLYLDLSSLPKGIYALQCQSDTDLIETKQIIIK